MSHRRAYSQGPARAESNRTKDWVDRHAGVQYLPGRDPSPIRTSCSTGVPSSRSTRITASTLSRASGNSVRNEMAAYEARKQRTVVPPPTTTDTPQSHSQHSHSHSHSISIAAIKTLTEEQYKRAPRTVKSPVEEGWPKIMPGRPPPSKASKASKPPAAFLRKRRPSDASQGGSLPASSSGYQRQDHGQSSASRSSKPLPPTPVSPVRQWTM